MDRFWNKVHKSGACWLWCAAISKKARYDGYGKFKINGKIYRAHRVSYALTYGLNLEFKGVIRHTCDNPRCVRPSHLLLGTFKDNSHDMLLRGRNRNGDQKRANNGNAKLTEQDVICIKKLILEGKNNKEIALNFKVGHAMISRIRLNKAWI